MNLPLDNLIAEAERCVVCGLCLPHCPTYRKTGSEADSPRGRIQLMRAVAQNTLPNNPRFKAHIDLCLSCRSCESACPNSVNYGALIDATRALYTPNSSNWRSLAKPFIRSRFLAKLLIWPLWLLQQFRLKKLLLRIIPPAKLLPKLSAPQRWKTCHPTAEPLKGNVSLFLGCAGSALDSQTLNDSIYLLNKLGYNVHIPKRQTCCGSIARQMGDADEAQSLISKNAACFNPNYPILTTVSGCGAGLKDYLNTHTILDISAFLANCDWQHVKISPLHQTLYVQDPCSLRNVLQSHKDTYRLLQKIPEIDIQALPGNSQCCGGAGAYTLTQPAMANALLQDKLDSMTEQQVTLLATSNIGCSLHISQGLRAQNMHIDVCHPVQIITRQIKLYERN
ncbi:MAG: (Fe-S)-binding protein [Methylotenera sp.]|nr:(Fe-S)-binding protein [Methylotenera sp.]